MGKALIISHQGDGLYTVQRVYEDERYQLRKATLEAQIESLTDQIGDLWLSLSEAEGYRQQAADIYQARVTDYVEALQAESDHLDGYRTAMEDAYKQFLDMQKQEQLVRVEYDRARLSRRNARSEIERLSAWEDPPAEEAWCADYTEDASGEVACIEIPGEPAAPLVVYPQDRGEGSHDPARDGMLMPREWMVSYQALWNAALLPGWQRYKPTYRVGTLDWVDKDNDTCGVSLDEAVSTAQSLPVNEKTSLTDVPVAYMECNAEAFESGDRVVVEFQGMSWDQPRVIGFESAPKECPYWPAAVRLGFHVKSGDLQASPNDIDMIKEIVDDGDGGCRVYRHGELDGERLQFELMHLGGPDETAMLWESSPGTDIKDQFSVAGELGADSGIEIDRVARTAFGRFGFLSMDGSSKTDVLSEKYGHCNATYEPSLIVSEGASYSPYAEEVTMPASDFEDVTGWVTAWTWITAPELCPEYEQMTQAVEDGTVYIGPGESAYSDPLEYGRSRGAPEYITVERTLPDGSSKTKDYVLADSGFKISWYLEYRPAH